MKNNLFVKVLTLILLISFSNCSGDDDNVVYKNNSLTGDWHLSSYGGGFTGQYISYDNNDVLWNFDTIAHLVHIKSRKEYFGPVSGTYPYIIEHDKDAKVIYLNDSLRGLIYIDNDKLVIENGLVAIFKR